MLIADVSLPDWTAIVRAEYVEQPGLSLSRPQVQRLWGLTCEACDGVLDELLRSGFLRRSTDGLFRRPSDIWN